MEKTKIKFRKINSQSSLVASATVPLIPEKGIWIKDWLIFEKEGKISSSPPSRRYQDSQGNIKYASYLSFESKDLYWKWCNRIADLYREWIASGGFEESQESSQEKNEDFRNDSSGMIQEDSLEVEGDDEFKVPF